MRPIGLALALVVLLPATAEARSLKDYQRVATQAAPHSPCAGKLRIELRDTLPEGAIGHADGLEDIGGVWTLRSCVVAVDGPEWRESDTATRCDVWVHEALHYATLPGRSTSLPIHKAGTILDEHLQEWPACHEREPVDLVLSVIPAGWQARCDKRRCRAWKGRSVRRYRVVGHGDRLRLRRVR